MIVKTQIGDIRLEPGLSAGFYCYRSDGAMCFVSDMELLSIIDGWFTPQGKVGSAHEPAPKPEPYGLDMIPEVEGHAI